VANYLCPKCSETDEVDLTPALTDAGIAVLIAQHPCHRAPEPYRWQIPDESPLGQRTQKLARSSAVGHDAETIERLGLHEKLRAAVAQFDDSWVEYGVVEHEFAAANEDLYRGLVKKMGHSAKDDAKETTVSDYLARLLGNMTRTGDVAHRETTGTGLWASNTSVSAWRVPSVPDDAAVLSWERYAADHDIDPATWPAVPSATCV
jgi:hypothetical protein